MAETKVDIARLKEKLEALTGYDLEAAELEERAAGNMTPEISFSKRYQARLAAKALGCVLSDIQSMKASEYTMATLMVNNFLFGSLAGNEVQPSNTEK
ncbi:MAG: hypothetical protein IJS96_07035 [Schwartzia sp.]|nr:hypothetical protein [Schwartzia sp. (in: firmicutes)]